MPFLESRASGSVIATILVIAAIGIVLPFTPTGTTLGFVPLPAAYWLPLGVILLSYATLTHLMKGTGSEVMQRIAVPMIGGMVSSTILTLVVIPAIYALVKGFGLRPGWVRPDLPADLHAIPSD